jgi:hypothetical protein
MSPDEERPEANVVSLDFVGWFAEYVYVYGSI